MHLDDLPYTRTAGPAAARSGLEALVPGPPQANRRRPDRRVQAAIESQRGAGIEPLSSILRGLVPFGALVAIALYLTIGRPIGDGSPETRARLSQAATLAVGVQLVHFLEELSQGFHHRYPELLGLKPWPLEFFVSFNVTWLLVWLLCLMGLRRHLRAALFPLWLLGIACVVNLVAHPLMALADGRYFPGLWTSPLAGLVGMPLLGRLAAYTRTAAPEEGDPER